MNTLADFKPNDLVTLVANKFKDPDVKAPAIGSKGLVFVVSAAYLLVLFKNYTGGQKSFITPEFEQVRLSLEGIAPPGSLYITSPNEIVHSD